MDLDTRVEGEESKDFGSNSKKLTLQDCNYRSFTFTGVLLSIT